MKRMQHYLLSKFQCGRCRSTIWKLLFLISVTGKDFLTLKLCCGLDSIIFQWGGILKSSVPDIFFFLNAPVTFQKMNQSNWLLEKRKIYLKFSSLFYWLSTAFLQRTFLWIWEFISVIGFLLWRLREAIE